MDVYRNTNTLHLKHVSPNLVCTSLTASLCVVRSIRTHSFTTAPPDSFMFVAFCPDILWKFEYCVFYWFRFSVVSVGTDMVPLLP